MSSEDSAETSHLEERLHAVIDRWFVDQFHGSVVATVTEHFNHVFAAVQDLKRRLAEEI